MGARGERARRSEGEQRGAKGAKRSEAYHILGFRVPITSVGVRGEGQKGAKGSEGEQSILYTRY